MMRTLVRRLLARWDAAGAALRAYAAEPPLPEPEPTIGESLQERFAAAERKAELLAQLQASMDAVACRQREIDAGWALLAAERDADLVRRFGEGN